VKGLLGAVQMQKALEAVAAVHKQRTRELKTQVRQERAAREEQAQQERAAWQATEGRLRTQIANLEKNRDELRAVLREQREQLRSFRALLVERDGSGEELGDSEEQPQPPEPQQQRPVVPPPTESATKRARVDASSLPATQLPAGREKEAGEEEGEEKWRIVHIGAPNKKGAAATGPASGQAFKAVVRGKKRKEMPVADDCAMCRQYYDALASETHIPRNALVQQCTRHRSLFPEVPTPEGYWAVGMSPPTK
jgi:hypothetical protein